MSRNLPRQNRHGRLVAETIVRYREAQLDLFRDYATNVALYPKFQSYFRTRKPPLLAVWGRNNPYFVPAGAEAFRRDIPDAQAELLDTGHFALETHSAEITATISEFLRRKLAATLGDSATKVTTVSSNR